MKFGPRSIDSTADQSVESQPLPVPPLPGPTASAQVGRGAFHAALGAIQSGHLTDAATFLIEAIRDKPAMSYYRAVFADVLLALNSFGAAGRSAEIAVALDPASPQALYLVGVSLRTAEDRRSALRLFLRTLALDPNFALAHLELGRLLESERRIAAALFHYSEAGRVDQELAEPHIRLANAYRRLGRLPEAWKSYVDALHRRPDDGATWGNLAATLSDMGQKADALACFVEALRLAPEDISARNNHALMLHQAGDEDRARHAFAVALSVDPVFTPALLNSALVEEAAGNGPGALELVRRAVRLQPARGQSWNSLGQAWRAVGEQDRAIRAWQTAIALEPACVEALGNLAASRGRSDAFAESERLVRRAMRMSGTNPLLYNILAQILMDHMDVGKSAAASRIALALFPSHADSLCNLGIAADHLNRSDALAWFGRAVVVAPDHALARFNRALAFLRDGSLADGWQDYAHRFAAGRATPVRRFAVPEWDGSSLAERRLFIWREQGVGDEFLFASCYPDAIKMAAGTIIECDRRLVSLFQRSFPKATVRAERPVTVPPRMELIDCDVHIPAGSLPRLLRPSLPEFPPRRSSWLYPNPERVAEWREWLEGYGRGLRVGISWRSRLMLSSRRPCYVALDRWADVFSVPGTQFFNLQYDECTDELEEAEDRFHRRIHRWPWLDLRDDFEGTAALIANLDLVIAPANSVGELAGALGVPVWRFSYRDWTHLGSDVRPWYPSMRIFQPFTGETIEAAMARLAVELARVAHHAARRRSDHASLCPDGR